MKDLGAIIAIDIGTTHTRVARFNGRAPELIPIDDEPMMPSVITVLPQDFAPDLKPEDRFLIGQDAIEAAAKDRSIRRWMFKHVKRHRGERWNDDEASGDGLVSGDDEFGEFVSRGMTHYEGPDETTYSPIELESAYILKCLAAARAKLKGREIRGAVLTVPAAATPMQRRAIEASAREAGLSYVEIMDEPAAAALAYGRSKRSKKRKVVVAFDVGGGTSDCNISEIGGDHIRQLGNSGSSVTGGADFDHKLANEVLNWWMRDHPDSDAAGDDSARSLLLDEAEETKKRLSRKPNTEFRIDDFDKSPGGVDRPLVYEISREEMERLCADELSRMEDVCRAAIAEAKAKDSKFSVRDVDVVVLIGGGTKMPAVQALVERIFEQEAKTDIDPEAAVVLGAAIQAAISEGLLSDITISAITPYAIRIETHDKVLGVATPIFDKGTSYPNEVFSRDLVPREPGQTSMPVRILVGNSDRAVECELAYSFNFEIDPADPKSQRIPFEIALNSRGMIYGICGGESFGDAI